MGDPVHPVPQLPIAPDSAVGRTEGGAPGAEAVDRTVQQFGRAVEAGRILQFGKVEEQFRPLVRGWQVLPGEGVEVR